jgi:hypothetical protein
MRKGRRDNIFLLLMCINLIYSYLPECDKDIMDHEPHKIKENRTLVSLPARIRDQSSLLEFVKSLAVFGNMVLLVLTNQF